MEKEQGTEKTRGRRRKDLEKEQGTEKTRGRRRKD